MRILLLTRQLNGVMGGLERQILVIADLLTSSGHHVTICSLDSGKIDPYYVLKNENIRFRTIGSSNLFNKANMRERLKRQFRLYKLLGEEHTDVCIAFMIGSLYVGRIPTLLRRVPIILSERNSPKMYDFLKSRRWKRLRFWFMRLATRITVQFPTYVNGYPRFLRRKIVAIPNSVPDLGLSDKRLINPHTQFVFAGRFSFQKQLLRLITGFNCYFLKGGEGYLHIYGSGEEEKPAQLLVSQMESKNQILFHPPDSSIQKVLNGKDILCAPSLWEGFPNVVAESLSMGIPVFGLMECDGVRDLIDSGVNGILISSEGDDSDYAAGLFTLEELLRNGEVTAQKCRDSVAQYKEEKISDKWCELLLSVSKSRP